MITKIRNTITKQIAYSPCTVIEYVRTFVDNGYGVSVPDLTKTAVATELGTCKVCRRRLPEPIITNAKTPYDFQDVYYLLADYTATWLRKGIVFEYQGKKFRTLLLEDRIINGQVAYKLCDLEQVNSYDVGDSYGS